VFEPILQLLQGGEVGRDIKISTDKKTHWTQEWAKAYFLQDGLLFHRASGSTLCNPHSQRLDVIREALDAILRGGHMGIEKTVVVVSSRYYWRRLTDSVANGVTGCDVCQQVKHKNARPYGLLQALPIPSERTERVNIDFITKLPASEDGYDAVTTTIHPLTKRDRCITVKESELTAEKFMKAFNAGYVRNRGLRPSIMSDRDTRFTSEFW
jgi:hypothetical protein